MTIETVSISKLLPAGFGQIPRPSDASQSAVPRVWLGAKSAFGLALPDAQPSASQLYAPRGVWLDHQRLVVCDSGNHRILIWNTVPQEDHCPADVVLGQSSFSHEGAAAAKGDVANGLKLPTGVKIVGQRLVVADAWHHRLLVWNNVPTVSGTPPDYAIGQSDLHSVTENRGRGRPAADSLYWPYGFSVIGSKLYVADTGNRRVLVWQEFPDADRPADQVWGQADFLQMSENRGQGVSARSFRWPHDITGDERHWFVADAGNHRVLFWNHSATTDAPACGVLGQPSAETATESPYQPPGPQRLRFPYSIACNRDVLAVADTANNRVLFFRRPIDPAIFPAAKDVIGQVDFSGSGENHWQAVTHHSLCWPYGICLHEDRLAIADSGNNRVMVWDVRSIVDRLHLESAEGLNHHHQAQTGCSAEPFSDALPTTHQLDRAEITEKSACV
jgi:hypothetical protein